MRSMLLAAFLCATMSTACTSSNSNARVDGLQCSAASAPNRLRPQQIAEHVRALAQANCVEQAQVWYLRGLVRAGVENALAPQENAFEAYGIWLQNAGAQSLRRAEPGAISALLEDAILWEAETPLEYPTNPDPVAVAEARGNVASFLRESVIRTQARAAEVSAVESQIASGVTDESRAIVDEAAHAVLTPLASVRIDCNDVIRFAAPFTNAPAASAEGRIAVVETCNDYRIIDTRSGATIQSVARADYYPIIVRAAENPLQVILAPTRRNTTGSASLLYVMSATQGVRPLTLALPLPQAAARRLDIRRSAGSADGNVVVLELGIGGSERSRYAAYDLRNRSMLWEGPDIGNPRSRLMWRVEQRDGDYILVSEVRRNQFDIEGGELLNLRTGRQEFVEYATLPVNYVDDRLPTCELVETSERGQSREFEHFLILPRGHARLALQDPPRASISDCTVSADGTQLLVAVPPFIHRFAIERRVP